MATTGDCISMPLFVCGQDITSRALDKRSLNNPTSKPVVELLREFLSTLIGEEDPELDTEQLIMANLTIECKMHNPDIICITESWPCMATSINLK